MNCLICKNNAATVICRKLRNGEKRKVYYCKKCELGMLENLSKKENLRDFYRNEYRKKFTPKLGRATNPRQVFDIYSKFQKERVDLIKPYLSKKMRLLEIGCSAGMFLFKIKKFVKEIIGFDYDLRCAKFASKKCSCRTYDIDINNAGIPLGKFDVICMFQALEHIDDPLSLFINISKYLKPEGLLFIEVPNLYDSLLAAYKLPNYERFYFHSAHRWYFTKKSLLLLMKKAGFTGKVVFTQDYNILNHMHWLSVDKPQDSCIPGLCEPTLTLQNGLKADKKSALSEFITRTDRDYKRLLSRLGLTSNLFFIGRKKRLLKNKGS